MQRPPLLYLCTAPHFPCLWIFTNISKKCEKLRKVEIFVPVMTQWQPWLSLASKPCATFHHSTLAVSAVNIKVTQTYQMWDGGGVHQDFGSDKSVTYTWQVCVCVCVCHEIIISLHMWQTVSSCNQCLELIGYHASIGLTLSTWHAIHFKLQNSILGLCRFFVTPPVESHGSQHSIYNVEKRVENTYRCLTLCQRLEPLKNQLKNWWNRQQAGDCSTSR